MHELSIVMDLVDLCEKNAKKANATKIEKVEISIGRLSGVEAHLLQNAFEVYKEGTICENAILDIIIQEIKVHCNSCNEDSVLLKNEFSCPKCSSTDLEVIAGEDMYLNKLTMI